MGYTTDFSGSISVQPPLSAKEVEYLRKFSTTRRMKCTEGPYYVDRGGFHGQQNGSTVLDYNSPPDGQPGVWCQWEPSEDGCEIRWDGGEKFYDSPEWMAYLIEHFVGSNPIVKTQLPFLTGHVLNGQIEAQGEDWRDHWMLVVKNNKVSVIKLAPNKELRYDCECEECEDECEDQENDVAAPVVAASSANATSEVEPVKAVPLISRVLNRIFS